jgi:hypothetical protein
MRVSAFLLLPRELRDDIYEYALGDYIIFSTQPERPLAMFLQSAEYTKNPLAILLACRSTYAEARLVPFAVNAFWYRPTCPPPHSDINTWMKKLLPAQLNAIRTVSLYLGRDIRDIDTLYAEALAPLTGLRKLTFRVYPGYTGSWREMDDEEFQLTKGELTMKLDEVLCADGVAVIFTS